MNWISWAKRAWPLFAQISPYFLPALPFVFLWIQAHKELKTCQRETQKLQAVANQAAIDQINHAHQKDLAKKDFIISEKDAEILRLREKNALDSVNHFSVLQSIRAINQRYPKR
ncbi:hypothetical protein [Siphonobacter sp. SORGH_AS_0500]|uniref:hypothetical protein n=1 Tax=Siphonobacter sp. SORGH_AS_0500 TaxID=1864824 RepID=UPI002856D474|nr:hypothetical protein [Siphonobacter sp. SORGH_AS_0500]MDR6195170.1 hypothetical protein [Siphonobacter sp. SORGH_AS_0500]